MLVVRVLAERLAFMFAAFYLCAGLLGFGPFHGMPQYNRLGPENEQVKPLRVGVSRGIRADEAYDYSPTLLSYFRGPTNPTDLNEAVSGFAPMEVYPVGPIGSFRFFVTPLSWSQLLPFAPGHRLAFGYSLLSVLGLLFAYFLARRLEMSRMFASTFAVFSFFSLLWQTWLVSGIGFNLSAGMLLAFAVVAQLDARTTWRGILQRAGLLAWGTAMVLHAGYPPATISAILFALGAGLFRWQQVGFREGLERLQWHGPMSLLVLIAVVARFAADSASFYDSLATFSQSGQAAPEFVRRIAWVPELFPFATVRGGYIVGELVNVCEDSRIAFLPLALFVLLRARVGFSVGGALLALLLLNVWLGVPIGLSRVGQDRLAMASGTLGALWVFLAMSRLPETSLPWKQVLRRAMQLAAALTALAVLVTWGSPFGLVEAIGNAIVLAAFLAISLHSAASARAAFATFAIAQALLTGLHFNPLVSHEIFDAPRPAIGKLVKATGLGLLAELSPVAPGNALTAFGIRTLFGRHATGMPDYYESLLAMRRDKDRPVTTTGFGYFVGNLGLGTQAPAPDMNEIDLDPCDRRLQLFGVSVASVSSPQAEHLEACWHWRALPLKVAPDQRYFALDAPLPTQAVVPTVLLEAGTHLPASTLADARVFDGYDRAYDWAGSSIVQKLRYRGNTLTIELEGARLAEMSQILMHETIYENSVKLDGEEVRAEPMIGTPFLKRVPLSRCKERCTIKVTYN